MTYFNETKCIEKLLNNINRIFDFHDKIKEIDKSLEKLYPIAVVFDSKNILIFDIDPLGKKYEYKMENSTMDFPQSIVAAKKLEIYEGKMSAIISNKIFKGKQGFVSLFEDIEDYVYIFHEFIHCFQFYDNEMNDVIKMNISKEAIEKNNLPLEILKTKKSFPYKNKLFIEKTIELNNGYEIEKYHEEMKKELNQIDFEYMILQEWHEGYACYIEKIIREKIGLKKEKDKLNVPFDRFSFYNIGSRYIEKIIKNNIKLKNNHKEIFYKMLNCEI